MRILLTGASRGIGAAIARRLAERAQLAATPLHLVLAANRHGAELETLAHELRETGAEVLTLLGDLADPQTPARLVAESVAFSGGLDSVVANAGITAPGPLASLEQGDWDRLFAVNVRAPWLLAKAARSALAQSAGTLVAVASMSGVQPHPGHGAYSASKAALIMLCQQLAQEWASQGIRVNCVSPGMIRTPLTESLYRNPEIAEQRKRIVPLGRVGSPEDIAGIVAFLLSKDAAFITGQNIAADGGYTASVLGLIPGLPTS